jgi:ketosteroid isomerase-like protein
MKIDELEKRLRTLEDIEEIKSLHREYIYYLLNSQWKEMADCFTEDAMTNIWRHGPRYGKTEIMKFFSTTIAGMNSGKGRDAHFAIEPVISINGDKAKGHWMMYIFIADNNSGVARYSQGRYDAEYIRDGGKWKFKSLIYTRPWPVTPETLPKPQ